MAEILIEGVRLRLRRAMKKDLDFIIDLEYHPDNLPYIVPFDREFHEKIITSGEASMDVIVEEVDSGEAVGYFLVAGLKTEAREMEWTHVIIAKKGKGYGHEAMQLLKKWCFSVKHFHRAWLDCKDYNERALHLYEREGMVREGLIRETIITNGVYENLVILGILDREYKERLAVGKELA
ncbi:MAG: GNAT family N-acetyltransferase [Selenomonas sp.]|uniref:GNAT family N-acetyltransferase n=1 Tax=Selenomonas sp. TaxID=2053611 RepID=UPI0025E188FB|nr:GNAT family protein [Selenomonas sp.]MCR5756781.1 GNAT family N-acetyltransferase [Selenomonas sp.]